MEHETDVTSRLVPNSRRTGNASVSQSVSTPSKKVN